MSPPYGVILAAAICASASSARVAAQGFDHEYAAYARLLSAVVNGERVDYSLLVAQRADLDRIVRAFGAVAADAERRWPLHERFAFWINAYNLFTLEAIADHYPIRGRWLSRSPRASIRQIDGVWTDLRFEAAGRGVTLDDIEHRILRREFDDPRLHFAINCASISCPPIRPEPYVGARLDEQLADASRRFLASPHGLRPDGTTLRVSRLFDWYGEDFIPKYSGLAPGDRTAKARAILGVIATYGPPRARDLARSPGTRVRFLEYDWSLNDVRR